MYYDEQTKANFAYWYIYIDRYARFVSFMNGKNQNKDIFHLIKRDN